MRTAQNLHRHELIGLEVVVKGSGNLSGLTGKIIDETRNMFLVETGEGTKHVPKKGNHFRFPEYEDVVLEGKEILSRPENRIKK